MHVSATLKPLAIEVAGTLAGQLSYHPEDGSRFQYRRIAPSQAVSLTLPVREAPYDGFFDLPPSFYTHLPEGELRRILTQRFGRQRRSVESFDLLGLTGPYQLGRVQVARPAGQAVPAPVNVQGLITHRGQEDLLEELLASHGPFSGVSGAQPKVLIRDADSALPSADPGPTHIVKFRYEHLAHLGANEYFAMRAALHAGLPVPAIALSEDGERLIVERFDIDETGKPLGFEDFCALMGLEAEGKYSASYEACVKCIRTFVSPARQAEALEQFFLTLLLSCALRNGDAHLKNFGVLYQRPEDEVWLAPVFDIISTTPYLPRDRLALTLAGSHRWPEGERLADFARQRCQLSAQQLAHCRERIGEGIRKAGEEFRDYARQRPAFAPWGENLLAIWAAGTDQALRTE